MHYENSYFSENATVRELMAEELDVPMTGWSDKDQCQLHHEALKYLNYARDEIEELCFKTEQCSVQKGIKVFEDKGKQSAMKEIKNIAIKNNFFGEVEHESLTREMMHEDLPMLVFMVFKKSDEIKSRRVVNGSYEMLCTDKTECASFTPDFYALKHVCATVAKEDRDVATIDLPGFFLQTEAEEGDDTIVRFTGAVALLLAECDEEWRKNLRRENGKWIIYAKCNKVMCGKMNAALMSSKTLARCLKTWGMK